MATAKMMGSGWHSQSVRHSNARRFGRAGGTYAKFYEFQAKGVNTQTYNVKAKDEDEAIKTLKKNIKEKGNMNYPPAEVIASSEVVSTDLPKKKDLLERKDRKFGARDDKAITEKLANIMKLKNALKSKGYKYVIIYATTYRDWYGNFYSKPRVLMERNKASVNYQLKNHFMVKEADAVKVVKL